jgi:hypothetical protein
MKMETKTVRAKFVCHTVTKALAYPDRFQWTYVFGAVTGGNKENESFWRYTPSGRIELSAIRDDLFEVGKEYYIDFTLFEPAPPAPVEELPAEEVEE